MKGVIYKYTFPDGKVYIGQTRRNPEIRKREHVDKLVGPTNTGFWEALQKYGEPEYEEILEIVDDNIDRLVFKLNYYETVAIRFFRATDPRYGYNKVSGGHEKTDASAILNKKYNEIFDQKIQSRLSTYFSLYDKVGKSKGILTKEELYLVKEKYRDRNIFQNHIDDYNFDQLSKNSRYSKEFLLDDALPAIMNLITEDLQNEITEFIQANAADILYEERRKKAIVQLDKDGNVVRLYMNTNEICQEFNVRKAENVLNVLKGKQKTAYGFYWKYARDLDKENNNPK